MDSQVYSSPYDQPFVVAAAERTPASVKRRFPSRSEAGAGMNEVQGYLVIFSTFALAMLLVIPIWNCVLICLYSPYTYLLGRELPLALAFSLAGCVALYAVLQILFFSLARKEVQSSQSWMMIMTAITISIGTVCIICGYQYIGQLEQAQNAVEQNCLASPLTAPLARESNLLYALRWDPSCADEVSVEKCKDFAFTREADVLKEMETGFKCSTFCNDLQAPDGTTPGGYSYPRTLFSQANYKASCKMSMVRNLKTHVQDAAIQNYWLGCWLVLVALACNLLKLMGFCTPSWLPGNKAVEAAGFAQRGPEGEGYGATPAPRYVRAGVLS